MADQINPDRILNALQDLEGLASGDLVVSYVLVMRTAVRDDPDADAYRVAYKGSLSEQIGLLRYASARAERYIMGIEQKED